MQLETGSIVGDYQIIGVLGEGGMGKVFKVRNTISDRVEAMKVLLPDLAGEPDLADRFLREIKVLASLDHPNIAALRTAVRFENQLLMIMELVEGMSLDQRLHQMGKLPMAEAVNSISQVLAALACAHGRGVIHRDIKPANMMLTADGTVKLMDFGIAKSEADRKLTMTGTTMGSLYYMSPEQISGAQTLDARSDLYSVGVSLYELVTGKRPFDGESQFAIMSAHLQKTPVQPITIDPSLPPELNDLIMLSVQREPGARFQTAAAFRNALSIVTKAPEPAAQSTVVVAPPMDADAAVAPPAPKSRRALWATAGALCFAAALAGVITLMPSKKTSAENPPMTAQTTPPAQSPAPVAPEPVSSPPASAPASEPAAPPVKSEPKTVAHAAKPAPATQTPMVRQPVAQPQQPVAAQTPPPQAPAPMTAPPSAPQPQPDTAAQARRAELQKLRESVATVTARANAIHITLGNLQRSQAASGLGMRSDWVQAQSLMDSFLRGAHDALNAGDAESARDLMEKGERQLEKLEKALNK
jgi:eukaryotic-like serine/threonine-protein kinase